MLKPTNSIARQELIDGLDQCSIKIKFFGTQLDGLHRKERVRVANNITITKFSGKDHDRGRQAPHENSWNRLEIRRSQKATLCRDYGGGR
jgi:hypothetical protein